MRTKIGNLFIWAGLLLVVAGIGLGAFNIWTENHAGEESAHALDVLTHQLAAEAPRLPQVPPVGGGEVTGNETQHTPDTGAQQTPDSEDQQDPGQTPDSQQPPVAQPPQITPQPAPDPYREMPTVEIDGVEYIGYLEIPSLNLTLPIIGETTNRNLQKAPCRFFGSAYLDNLVVGAHNYQSHFGRLGRLSYGDILIFTDMEGNVFTYEVADIETLKAYQGEYLCNGEWDLSLFTCTLSGDQRITIRCQEI